MKRAVFIFIATGLILFETACASSLKAIIEQKDPIALVSMVSNWDINWKDEDPIIPNNILFGNSGRRDNPDRVIVSNAEELINTAETLFRAALAGSPINLAEKETVLSSRAYREAKLNNTQIRNKMVKPSTTGTVGAEYAFINYSDKNFPAALANETGIQRVMFVEFDFTKAMRSGFGKNGELRAELDMTVLVLDKAGKTLYRKTFFSWSDSTIRVSGGAYSHSALMEIFESAINEAYLDLLASL